MTKPLGRVVELVRYPIKSMAGIATESAYLGWHGLAGDRRFAFRRVGDRSGFPWLTASRLPDLLLYQPCGLDEGADEPLPTHVRTPEGVQQALWSPELQREVSARLGSELELMQLRHGIFDDASVSLIASATIAGVGREAGVPVDRRRFRANIVIECDAREPFVEDTWVGRTLVFGEREPRPAVRVTAPDVRCKVINLDPQTGEHDVRMLKTVARLNKNNAGVYGTVVRAGTISIGESVSLVVDEKL